MNRLQFLLDEHVNPRLRRALKERAANMVVWCIGDVGAPARGTADDDILRWCEEHGFVLLTNDRATMPIHLQAHLAAGRRVPGILIIKRQASFSEMIDDLILIWEASLPGEYQDQIRYLPLSR
jgi:predicted nuclease of predicted toxin-antitoxin system